jgi:hypothetical protein
MDLDLDCDGTLNEEPGQIRQQKPGSGFLGIGKQWIYDVNRDSVPGTDVAPSNLISHDDWSALNFGGGGILGPLDLPPRADTAPVPELTSPEVVASAAAAAAEAQRLAKQIVIRVIAGPKRAAGRVRLTVKVTLNGKNVRQARVRVKGGILRRGASYVVTNRRGSARLTFKAKRGARIVVSAKRKGLSDGGVALKLKR